MFTSTSDHSCRPGVGEAAHAADRHGQVSRAPRVGREHDLAHRRLVPLPQRGEAHLLVVGAAGERVVEGDTRLRLGAGGDGHPDVGRADDLGPVGKRAEVERGRRGEDDGGHLLRRLRLVTGHGSAGEERRDRRREGGAPGGADAAEAAVGFKGEVEAFADEEEEIRRKARPGPERRHGFTVTLEL